MKLPFACVKTAAFKGETAQPPPTYYIGDAYPPEVSDGLAPKERAALGRMAKSVRSSNGKLRFPQDFTKGKSIR